MRNSIQILTLALFSLFTCCDGGNKNIFWISGTEGHNSDFIFMVESTNVLPIHADSLIYYLTNQELQSLEKLTFKNFGKISENETFKAIVLLKEKIDSARNYTFIIRTYNTEFKVIDSYDLATWVDSENRYCFGSINDELIIQRSCDEGKEKNILQILNDGRIVESSYLRKE